FAAAPRRESAFFTARRASALRSKVLFLVVAASSRGVGGVRLVGNPRLYGLGRTERGLSTNEHRGHALSSAVVRTRAGGPSSERPPVDVGHVDLPRIDPLHASEVHAIRALPGVERIAPALLAKAMLAD